MLQDISHQVINTSPVTRPATKPALMQNRESLLEVDELLPIKVKAKRVLASSSSSSPQRPFSSSPGLGASLRFAPYEAPTSPSLGLSKASSPLLHPSPLPTSPTRAPPVERVAPVNKVTCSDAPKNVGLSISPSTVLRPTEQGSRISMTRGVLVQFGRKIKRRRCDATAGVTDLVSVIVPKSAKHASRVHCTALIVGHASAEHDPRRFTLHVNVLGQNGIKINGQRFKRGTPVKMSVQAGESVELDFYGWRVELNMEPGLARGIRNSVEAIAAEVLGMETDAHVDGGIAQSSSVERRDDTPASPALSALSALPSSSPVRASAVYSSAHALQTKLQLDLAGLIASAIVFSPRSTVGVEEVCRALLKDVGGMWDVLEDGKGSEDQSEDREDRAVEEWWDVIENVMLNEPFFGRIDNSGLKDASGNPLLPVYYYVPDSDPSHSRVEALEPFVKRVRGARTAKPVQYFWAKPSLRKNR